MIPKELLNHNTSYYGPGKFEGEAPYVEWLWENQEACSEDFSNPNDDILYSMFELTADECSALDLSENSCVILWETDQGFVDSAIWTLSEWDEWKQAEEDEYFLNNPEDDDL